ncbi:cell division protein FtsQ [Secundilactobacillus oryzae JCM 18671]|uniref:Cell division protein DivIB n=1 Tax=Secundilactobacillus oryzae JCM 18671 TaxID=1291743 RepID=A0A081BGL8_9LACO|nr:cell division protein FtsQ/DivIB [Secundilactobacillus oryzae]GAK47186.1 cell division protein FtsQ [Secundilactobacillus oryzae JCM 18671]
MSRKTNQELTPWQKYQKQQKEQQRAQSSVFTKARPKRIGKKLSKLRKQQNWKLFWKMGSLIVIFGAALLFIIYLISPLSHIQSLKVSGNQALSDRSVLSSAGLKKGDAIFNVLGQEKALTQRARSKNVKIRSLQVSISHLNHVKVHITEYKTAAFLLHNNKYHVILESGVISKVGQKQPTGHYPIISRFKKQSTTHKMISQYNKLEKSVQQNISEIRFAPTKSNPMRVHLFMNDGNEVYATLTTLAKKMAYYNSISTEMKQNGVINLEVGAYSYPFK